MGRVRGGGRWRRFVFAEPPAGLLVVLSPVVSAWSKWLMQWRPALNDGCCMITHGPHHPQDARCAWIPQPVRRASGPSQSLLSPPNPWASPLRRLGDAIESPDPDWPAANGWRSTKKRWLPGGLPGARRGRRPLFVYLSPIAQFCWRGAQPCFFFLSIGEPIAQIVTFRTSVAPPTSRGPSLALSRTSMPQLAPPSTTPSMFARCHHCRWPHVPLIAPITCGGGAGRPHRDPPNSRQYMAASDRRPGYVGPRCRSHQL